MLNIFFDVRGIVHSDLRPKGRTIIQQIQKAIPQCMLRLFQEKRRELWQEKSSLLHLDSAPPYNDLSIQQQFLTERNIAVLKQLPYLPDLALCDFFLCLKLEGACFQGVGATKRAVMKELRGHPRKIFPPVYRSRSREERKDT